MSALLSGVQGNVIRRTLFNWNGVQEVLVLMAPLLMLAASLIDFYRREI